MANLNQFCDFTKLIGIDIAKSVFQIYSCDTQTGEITNVQIKRDKVLESLANCGKCLIGMEACGSSQYWARKLQALGHTVRLMDPKLVKPFVRHNKSDKADAEGVYHALVSGVRAVAVKTETERDIQTLLTMRALLVKQRTARINHVRGLLAEYGHVMPKSVDQFDKKVDECINSLEGDAVQLVIDMLRDTVKSIRDEHDRIKTIQREISRLANQTRNAKHFLTVPGIGETIMAYMCVLLADPTQFSSGRQFAAYLGLVPMHTGSGGKTVTTKIPGRCDKALRALLVQGAHAVARSKYRTDWVKNILAKKPKKVAMVAIANRMARQCWAVASKGQDWRRMPVTAA